MMGHFIAGVCTVLLLASSSIGQLANELVYPEPDTNASTTPLYFGLMMSFGGSFESGGTVPGMQVALDQVNSDPSLLPGYSLHFILTDSQELDVIHHYFVYICDSESQDIILGILYGYKAILQAVALLFAFSTQKVKVKGLNDAKYIGAAIYVTSIVLTVIIVSTYTLRDYVNIYAVVFGLGLLVGTTMVLVLVFVPKMLRLYRDPQGEKVFPKSGYSSGQHQQLKLPVQAPPTVTLESHETVDALKKRIFELNSSLRLNSQNGIPSPPTCESGKDYPINNLLPDARED